MSRFAVVLCCLLSTACARGAIGYTGRISPRGVRQAAPVPLKLHVFETGSLETRTRYVYKGGKKKVVLDQPAYLIEHPDYGLVMFEAGINPEVAEGGRKYVGVFMYTTGLLRMDQKPGQDARTQIKAAGFDPDEIKMIVVSHFHPEHGGAVEYFPKTGIAVDKREYDYIMGDPKYNFFPKEYDKVDKWLKVDFSGSQLFGPFEGYVDVVGDGSIILIATPGHTPGHVSMLLRLPEGPVLLTGDVAWHQGNIDSETIGMPFVSVSGKGARRSLGRLLRFKKEFPEVLLVPGHDLTPLRKAKRKDVVIHPFPPPETKEPHKVAEKKDGEDGTGADAEDDTASVEP